MYNSAKKFQLPLLLLMGISMFLPIITISAYNQSESISIFKALSENVFNSSIFGKFDGYIMLGLIIITFIMLLVNNNKNNIMTKVISLVFIVFIGVLFFHNTKYFSDVKTLFGSYISYGVAYYILFGGIIVSFIIGLIDIITNRKSSYSPVDFVVPNNIPVNPVVTNPNIPVNNNPTVPVNDSPVNGVKLSDLVNNNSVNIENNNTNNNNINN